MQAVRVEGVACDECGKERHYRRDFPGAFSTGRDSASGVSQKRSVVCWNCDEEGHVMAHCEYERRPVDGNRKRYGPLFLKSASGANGGDRSGNEKGSSK